MFRFIKEFLEYRRLKQQRKTACQRFVVQQAMVKFFEDLQRTKGTVDLPPFILAVDEVNKLKTPQQIDKMYKRLAAAGLV
jgi:hypothetical protein